MIILENARVFKSPRIVVINAFVFSRLFYSINRSQNWISFGPTNTNSPYLGLLYSQAYVDNAEETSKKVLRDVFRRGDVCFRTGDLMVVDPSGWLYFRDRLGDTFRWRGENVSTSQAEAALGKALGGRADVVVFGVRVPGSEGRAGMAAVFGKVHKCYVDPNNYLDPMHCLLYTTYSEIGE